MHFRHNNTDNDKEVVGIILETSGVVSTTSFFVLEVCMCGFVGAFDLSSGSAPIAEGLKEELRAQVLEMSKRIRHRGPDWNRSAPFLQSEQLKRKQKH